MSDRFRNSFEHPPARAEKRRGRPSQLRASVIAQLEGDLRGDCPDSQGAVWSGAALARHIERRYGITLGARRCRQILRELGVLAVSAISMASATGSRGYSGPRADTPNGSPRTIPQARLRAIALKRLRRLAVAGLPLQPFVRGMFDIVQDALPNSDNKVMLCDASPPFERYVSNSAELMNWALLQQHYYVEAPPEVSGMVPLWPKVLGPKAIWRSEELALPHFYRSEGYNEYLRRVGFHHFLSTTIYDGTDCVGVYPIWRGPTMKPFSAEDARFMASAAPLVGHGLASARAPNPANRDGFVAANGTEGVVIIDPAGRTVAADDNAQEMFRDLGLFDDLSLESDLAACLRYIALTIREILPSAEDGSDSRLPAARLFYHHTGAMLSLRAVAADGDGGRYVTVIVRRGESLEHRRLRIAHCYGLSPRETEFVHWIGLGIDRREISRRMSVSPGTTTTYLRRLQDKLGLESGALVRRFAREQQI